MTVQVIQPFVSRLLGGFGHTADFFFFCSFYHFLAARERCLTHIVISSWKQRLLSFKTCVVINLSSCCFQNCFFGTAFHQSIQISWPRPNAEDDMASLPWSPSHIASAIFPTSENTSNTATTVVFTCPNLAKELPPQADTGSPFPQTIDASTIQAVSSPVRAVSSPTQVIVSVSTRFGCTRSCYEKLSSSVKQF